MKAGDVVKINGVDSVCLSSNGKEALFVVKNEGKGAKWVTKAVPKPKKKAAPKKSNANTKG